MGLLQGGLGWLVPGVVLWQVVSIDTRTGGATRITLYEHPISPYARKVKRVLFEKNVPFESEVVNLVGEQQRQPQFMKISPFRKVPVSGVGDPALFESTAINEYLEEKCPTTTPPLPADLVLRGAARAWKEVGEAYFGQVLGGAAQQTVRRPRCRSDRRSRVDLSGEEACS